MARKSNKIKKRKLSIAQQFFNLYTKYKSLIIDYSIRPQTYIIFKIKPAEFCRIFKVKVCLKVNTRPKVFIINPNLKDENEIRPPHLYSFEKGRICLFVNEEVDLTSSFTKIIPWAAEWILFYEIWRLTGNWDGGGHSFSSEDFDE